MGHPSRSVEDNSVKSNVDYWESNQAVSESKNISEWAKDNCCNILSKNMADLCSCPKNFPEAKLKSFSLILLEDI